MLGFLEISFQEGIPKKPLISTNKENNKTWNKQWSKPDNNAEIYTSTDA